MTYKELLSMPGMIDKLRFPQIQTETWGRTRRCEFHKGFGHDVEHYIALGYQLVGLIKYGFLKEFFERT